jgi:hypothetical protein
VHASDRGLTSVFNLEVYARHEFFVGEAGVRAHNGYAEEAARGLDLSRWAAGSFGSRAESLLYHFQKHGRDVGATSMGQYLNNALGFAGNLRSATRSRVDGTLGGVIRYKKLNKHFDLDDVGNIVSFGIL